MDKLFDKTSCYSGNDSWPRIIIANFNRSDLYPIITWFKRNKICCRFGVNYVAATAKNDQIHIEYRLDWIDDIDDLAPRFLNLNSYSIDFCFKNKEDAVLFKLTF